MKAFINRTGILTLTGPLAANGRVIGEYLGVPFAGKADHDRGYIIIELDEPLLVGCSGFHVLRFVEDTYTFDTTLARTVGATVTRIADPARDAWVEPEGE